MFESSAQSVLSDVPRHTNMAAMLELFELLDRVMGSRRKVYRNRLPKGDLKESYCEFSGAKCKCVHFFVSNLELLWKQV